MEAFQALCKRLTDRCQSLRMDIQSMAENGPVVLMDWKMTMAFQKYPATPVYGATKLTFNEEGLIIEQRDYYDLWGDIFNGIPRFNKMYRRFMHKKIRLIGAIVTKGMPCHETRTADELKFLTKRKLPQKPFTDS
jgi:hypothetical protein